MEQSTIIYFDIASVVITFICLASLVFRHKISGPINRVYISCILLVLITSLAAVVGEAMDGLVIPLVDASHPDRLHYVLDVRSGAKLLYYTLRCLTAPVYLVLISAVSGTSHRLNQGTIPRIFLWVPMLFATLFVMANPYHHLVYTIENGVVVRGPFIWVIYLSSLYYSVIGIYWLLRWRKLVDRDSFATLMSLYAIVFSAVVVQYNLPYMRVEMFVTSVVLMLVSAFIIRPELQQDSLVDAGSLHAYHELCRGAFATQKQLCLVYLEIVNLEQMRELVGKDELQGIIRTVSAKLTATLERGDAMYYLRNGLFCIVPRKADAVHALATAHRTHEEGKKEALAQDANAITVALRTCVVRIPEDVNDLGMLRNFVRRFARLVPSSTVTTYEELSKRDDFELQMALSNVVARAIRTESFEVHYQPICCLKDGKFHTAEALIRLHDSEFGYVPPALFIPEAEQSGAILAIGAILLDKIFEFLSRVDYQAMGLQYVEVNLSAEQCVRAHTAHMILGMVDKYQVDPAGVNFEITETSSAYSMGIVDRNVRTLTEAGFTFSLDDYGTGYSSVTRALSLPFSIIKFDKAFVDGLGDPATHTVFAQSIAMMRSIGKEVLVEGVETLEQVRDIKAMGADYIQGFYYAKPLPEDELVAFLTEHNGA